MLCVKLFKHNISLSVAIDVHSFSEHKHNLWDMSTQQHWSKNSSRSYVNQNWLLVFVSQGRWYWARSAWSWILKENYLQPVFFLPKHHTGFWLSLLVKTLVLFPSTNDENWQWGEMRFIHWRRDIAGNFLSLFWLCVWNGCVTWIPIPTHAVQFLMLMSTKTRDRSPSVTFVLVTSVL